MLIKMQDFNKVYANIVIIILLIFDSSRFKTIGWAENWKTSSLQPCSNIFHSKFILVQSLFRICIVLMNTHVYLQASNYSIYYRITHGLFTHGYFVTSAKKMAVGWVAENKVQGGGIFYWLLQ